MPKNAKGDARRSAVQGAIARLERAGAEITNRAIWEQLKAEGWRLDLNQVNDALFTLGILTPEIVRPTPECIERTDAAVEQLRRDGMPITVLNLARALGVSDARGHQIARERGWVVGGGVLEGGGRLDAEGLNSNQRLTTEVQIIRFERIRSAVADLEAQRRSAGEVGVFGRTQRTRLTREIATRAGVGTRMIHKILMDQEPADLAERIDALLNPPPPPASEEIPSPAQGRFMRFVEEVEAAQGADASTPGEGPRQVEIAEHLGCSRQNVSLLLRSCQAQGWAKQAPSSRRLGSQQILLTPEGREALKRLEEADADGADGLLQITPAPTYSPKEFAPRQVPTAKQLDVLATLSGADRPLGIDEIRALTGRKMYQLIFHDACAQGWMGCAVERRRGWRRFLYSITEAGREAVEAAKSGTLNRKATYRVQAPTQSFALLVEGLIEALEDRGEAVTFAAIASEAEAASIRLTERQILRSLEVLGRLSPEVVQPSETVAAPVRRALESLERRGAEATLKNVASELGCSLASARSRTLRAGRSIQR